MQTSKEETKRIRLFCHRSRKKFQACLSFAGEYTREDGKEFLQKRPSLHRYKIQILHEIKGTDEYTRIGTSNLMLNVSLFCGA